MSENSGMMRIDFKDLIGASSTAVFAAVVFALYGFTQQPDFSIFSADWGAIFGAAFNAAIAAFIGSLGRRFTTDKDGKLFGAIKTK